MSYPGEYEDVRDEFIRDRRYFRQLENACQGRPICGCPICEPEEPEYYPDDDEVNDDEI